MLAMKQNYVLYSADEVELTIDELFSQFKKAEFIVKASNHKKKQWLLLRDDKEFGQLFLTSKEDEEFTELTSTLLTLSAERPLVSKLFTTLHENVQSVLSITFEHNSQETEKLIRQLDPVLKWLREIYLGAIIINDSATFWSEHDHHEIWQLDSYEDSCDEDDKQDSWGCLASGVKDDFNLDVLSNWDETKYELTIDYREFHLSVDIAGPETIEELIDYFKDTLRTGKYRDTYVGLERYEYMPEKSCLLGYLCGLPVTIAKCGECDDHYYLRCSSEEGEKGNFTVSLKADVIDKFVATLEQVKEDLDESGEVPPEGV